MLWLDCSTLHSNPDGEGVFQRISPRRKNSHWTELNIERCKKMIAEGRMTEAGLKVMPKIKYYDDNNNDHIVDRFYPVCDSIRDL